MGNIFKTLGIDDFFRDKIPVVGGGIANFLNGIPMGQKSGPGANQPSVLQQGQGGFLGGMTSLFDPPRMSNEDYQFGQDLLDSSNPREIKRQSAFLEGVAPSQAAAHNTYQDQVYAQDTQRQTERMQQMSKELKVSPWDLLGTGGAAPVQGAPQAQGGGTNAQFLSQLAPLQIAKMNNETALKTTKMQTDTQKYVADQSTNQGELPRAQTTEAAARTVTQAFQQSNISADTNLKVTQAAVAENQQLLNGIATLLNALPTTTVDLGMFKSSAREGYEQVLRIIENYGEKPLTNILADGIRKLPEPQFDQFTKDMVKLASMIGAGAKGAMNTVSSLEGLWLTLKNMLGGK